MGFIRYYICVEEFKIPKLLNDKETNYTIKIEKESIWEIKNEIETDFGDLIILREVYSGDEIKVWDTHIKKYFKEESPYILYNIKIEEQKGLIEFHKEKRKQAEDMNEPYRHALRELRQVLEYYTKENDRGKKAKEILEKTKELYRE